MENTFSEKAAMKTNSFSALCNFILLFMNIFELVNILAVSFVIFLGFVVPLILVRPERSVLLLTMMRLSSVEMTATL